MMQQESQTQAPGKLHTSKIMIPINNISSPSGSSVSAVQTNQEQQQQQQQTSTSTTAINTEEFAKLDALLEDLLAEVEQPILLNKYNENLADESFAAQPQHQQKAARNIPISNSNPDEIERSVDWLNEQKEILRSRKELSKSSAVKVSDAQIKYVDNSSHFENSLNNNNNSDEIPSLNGALNGYLSYQTRPLLSPTSQQKLHSLTHGSQSFRSLSTNPGLGYRNNMPNEATDDEVNMVDADFDRYSQRSFRSNAGTVQRSKYHTVSNDFVECTRPTAPTPVPPSTLYQSRTLANPGKRALSAPPVELGKVMLQRMELKSPVPGRQGSAVPFEQQPKMIQYSDAGQVQRGQTPVNQPPQQRYIQDNGNSVYTNGRGILKQQQQNMVPYNGQPQTRNVFLNKAYGQDPRQIAYMSGYETDSCIPSGYETDASVPNGYGTYRGDMGMVQRGTTPIQNGYSQHAQIYNTENVYMPHNNNNKRNIVNGYRTIGGPSRSYRANHEQGYETDTGLIKLRQALDNRRALSRNDLPIYQQQQQQQQQIMPNGYFYQPPAQRSMTPSFNYVPGQYNRNPYSSHMTTPIPQDTNQFVVDAYSSDMDGVDMSQNGQFMDQHMPEFQQYNSSVGLMAEGGNANTFFTEDGRQIIMQEVEPEPMHNTYNQHTLDRYRDIGYGHPISQSMVVTQQRAPSAYTVRDTPSRLGYTSSATNISVNQPSYLNGQLSTSQQLVKPEPRVEQNTSRRSSASVDQNNGEVIRNHPKSVKNTQNFWYKPKISRDEAISLLKDKEPGTFLIRDSNNFPGAYGLALKVDKPPANVQIKPGADPMNELVRHFLIEPTAKGVRIKGCYNEPVFGSLPALVYQHSLTALALPIKLNLPLEDLTLTIGNQSTHQQAKAAAGASGSSKQAQHQQQQHQHQHQQQQQQQAQDSRHLLEKGAACQVFYISTVNVQDKTGLEAISLALTTNKAFQQKDNSGLLLIQFKVTSQGITLTDLGKKKFVRQQFPTASVSYCAIEEKHTWPNKIERISKPRIFGVITKSNVEANSNECHLFVELDQDQPAIAIVDFINRYLIPSKQKKELK